MRFLFDKTLLSTGGTIGRLFLPVKAYLGIRKAGLAMRLGTEGGTSAALLRNQLTVWLSHPSRGHFEHNSGRPSLHIFFNDAYHIITSLSSP
jgi:hypothetical protein